MTSVSFCYWLQGYFELLDSGESPVHGLTPKQGDIIRNHLNLVFKHELDPKVDGGNPVLAAELQAVHDGHPPRPNPSRPSPLRC